MQRYINLDGNIASGASTASYQLGDPGFDGIMVYRGSMSTAAELAIHGSYDGTSYYQMTYPRDKKLWRTFDTAIASGASHISVTLGDPPGPVMIYRGSMSTSADVKVFASYDASTYFQATIPQAPTSTSGYNPMFIGSGVTGVWMQFDIAAPYIRLVATDVVSGGVSIAVCTYREPVTMVIPSGVTSVYNRFDGPFPPHIKFAASAVVSGGVTMSVVCVDNQ